jgi:hypothetical protein
MKNCHIISAIALLFLLQTGFAQSFVNLNFEQATIVPDQTSPYYPYEVFASNAIPGWTGYINGNPVDRIFYNTESLGGPSISLESSLSPVFQPIQGSYSVYLKSFSDTGGTSAAIGQTAQIPNNASSLRFLRIPNSGFDVSFAGQNIYLVQLGTFGNYILMGGDISQFAGQTGELKFLGTGLFDAIQFSNQAIPEPSGLALFSVGALLVGFFRRQNSSR